MVQRHTIVIKSNRYIPNTLHITQGDEVVWDNQDGHHHTATSNTGATLFDTGEILGHSQSRAITLDHASEPSGFEYTCAYHDFMTGRLFVVPATFVLPKKFASTDAVVPEPTYSTDQWKNIARLVAFHWILDMTDNFVYARTIHRDTDLAKITIAWD